MKFEGTQASLDSMPKDMRDTKENKRNIKSKKEYIDVPEFERSSLE